MRLYTFFSNIEESFHASRFSFKAQMVRRVKAYLKNMKVITDEDKLHAMSLECEPPIGGSSTSAAPAIQIPPPSVRHSLYSKKKFEGTLFYSVTKTEPKSDSFSCQQYLLSIV